MRCLRISTARCEIGQYMVVQNHNVNQTTLLLCGLTSYGVLFTSLGGCSETIYYPVTLILLAMPDLISPSMISKRERLLISR